MKFCPYCGRQLGENEVCNCQNATNNNDATQNAVNETTVNETTEAVNVPSENESSLGNSGTSVNESYQENYGTSANESYQENTGSAEDGFYNDGQGSSENGGFGADNGAAPGQGGDILSKIIAFLKSKSALYLLCGVVGLIIVFSVIAAIAGSNPKKKVINAAKKTFNDSGYLFKDLSKFKTDGSKLTYTVSAKYDDLDANVSFIINGNEKAITGKLANDGDTIIEAAAMIDKKDVKACFPGLDYKKLLVYRYTEEDKDGLEDYIGKKNLESIDAALKALYEASVSNTGNTGKLTKDLEKWSNELEYSKIDSKSFKVDGEKRDCKGYELVLKESDLTDFVDIVSDWVKEEYSEQLEDILGKDNIDKLFDDAKKELKGTGKITLRFYLYKGMIAAVVAENKSDDKITAEFNGGDYRMQEINVYSGKKSDDKPILKISGKVRDSKETVIMEIPNSFAAEYSYDKSSGKFSVTLKQYDGWNDNFKEFGTLKGKLEMGSSKIALHISSIDVQGTTIDLGDIGIEISTKVSMPKMKGTEFRIDEADKEDIEDEIKDLSDELKDAIYESDLMNILGNLMNKRPIDF